MRNFLLSLCLAPLALVAQDHATSLIKWTDLETAQAAAKKDGKPVFIDVNTVWCGPCRLLASRTFMDKQTAEYINTHYHPVNFNAEGPDTVVYNGKTYANPGYDPARSRTRNSTHELTRTIAPVNGRIAYPTIVYMDSEGKVLTPVQGYMTPEQIEPILHFFGDGTYKKQEFDAFRKAFVSKRQ